jgi:predicted SpoU family rRNA methylase
MVFGWNIMVLRVKVNEMKKGIKWMINRFGGDFLSKNPKYR